MQRMQVAHPSVCRQADLPVQCPFLAGIPICALLWVPWRGFWCTAAAHFCRFHLSVPLFLAALCGPSTFRVRAVKPPPGLAPAQIQHLSPSASLLATYSLLAPDTLPFLVWSLHQPQGPDWTLTVRFCGAVPARPKYLVSGQGKREKRFYNGIR